MTVTDPPERVVLAPGRVNLIGEHTDYNEGFVLPMAIDRSVRLAFAAREDRCVRLRSLAGGETDGFSLDRLEPGPGGFGEYARGVAAAFPRDRGPLRGFDGVIGGDLPVGAGLSSSAALLLSFVRAFETLSGRSLPARAAAEIARRAENEWVGVPSGIMDPLVCAAGVEGSALLIDCRSLEIRPIPLPPAIAVVVLDTGTRRGLVDSAYARRRDQCEAAARALGVPSLRDVTPARLEAEGAALDGPVRRRARHVVSENARTLRAARALRAGDAGTLGRLLVEGHASLRDDFEVSTEALDRMVELACADPAVHGARMTGAGFGGAAVAIVRAPEAERVAREVVARYRKETGHPGRGWVCRAAAGAAVTP